MIARRVEKSAKINPLVAVQAFNLAQDSLSLIECKFWRDEELNWFAGFKHKSATNIVKAITPQSRSNPYRIVQNFTWLIKSSVDKEPVFLGLIEGQIISRIFPQGTFVISLQHDAYQAEVTKILPYFISGVFLASRADVIFIISEENKLAPLLPKVGYSLQKICTPWLRKTSLMTSFAVLEKMSIYQDDWWKETAHQALVPKLAYIEQKRRRQLEAAEKEKCPPAKKRSWYARLLTWD